MFGSPAELKPEPEIVHAAPLGAPELYACVRQLRSAGCAPSCGAPAPPPGAVLATL